jgi:collagen type VII alpha
MDMRNRWRRYSRSVIVGAIAVVASVGIVAGLAGANVFLAHTAKKAAAKRGPRGPRGKTGNRGPAGPAGKTGPEGIVFVAGTTGATGPTGRVGATGLSGGPAGPTGETGPTGGRGATGATGTTGATGSSGGVTYSGQVTAAGVGTARQGSGLTVAGSAGTYRLTLSGGANDLTKCAVVAALNGGTSGEITADATSSTVITVTTDSVAALTGPAVAAEPFSYLITC